MYYAIHVCTDSVWCVYVMCVLTACGVLFQGVCKPCHPSCLTCRGAAATDCFQCTSGYERQEAEAGGSGAGSVGGGVCHKTMLWDLLDPAVMKHLAWAIILCIGAIILCSLAFAILQARQRRKLCWAAKHTNYLPDWTKGAYNSVTAPAPTDEPDRGTTTAAASPAETGGGGGGGGKEKGVGGRRREDCSVLAGISPSLFKAAASSGGGGGGGGTGGAGGGGGSSPTTVPPPLPPRTCTSLPTLMGNFRLNSYTKPGFMNVAYPFPGPGPHHANTWLPDPDPDNGGEGQGAHNPLYTQAYPSSPTHSCKP